MLGNTPGPIWLQGHTWLRASPSIPTQLQQLNQHWTRQIQLSVKHLTETSEQVPWFTFSYQKGKLRLQGLKVTKWVAEPEWQLQSVCSSAHFFSTTTLHFHSVMTGWCQAPPRGTSSKNEDWERRGGIRRQSLKWWEQKMEEQRHRWRDHRPPGLYKTQHLGPSLSL